MVPNILTWRVCLATQNSQRLRNLGSFILPWDQWDCLTEVVITKHRSWKVSPRSECESKVCSESRSGMVVLRQGRQLEGRKANPFPLQERSSPTASLKVCVCMCVWSFFFLFNKFYSLGQGILFCGFWMSGKWTDHKGWRIFFGTTCGAMGFSGSFHRPQSCWWVALNRFQPLHRPLFFTFYSDLPQDMDNGNSTAYKLGEETCRLESWSLCDTSGGHNPALIKTAWPGMLESSLP